MYIHTIIAYYSKEHVFYTFCFASVVLQLSMLIIQKVFFANLAEVAEQMPSCLNGPSPKLFLYLVYQFKDDSLSLTLSPYI